MSYNPNNIPGYGINTGVPAAPAQPQYGAQPQYAQPQYGAPVAPAPGYGTPAPQYGAQPQYGAPVVPAPGYGTPAPQYGAQPQYGAPAPQYGAPAPQYGAPGAAPVQTQDLNNFGVMNYGTVHTGAVQSPAATLMSLVSSLTGRLKQNQLSTLDGSQAMSDATGSLLTTYIFDYLGQRKADMIVLKKRYVSRRTNNEATFGLMMSVGRDDRLNANLPLLQRYGIVAEATAARVLNTIVSLCVSGAGTTFQDAASVIDRYCSMFITIEYYLGDIYTALCESGQINDPQIQELFARGALFVEWGGMTITPYLSRTADGRSRMTFMYGLAGQISKTTVKADLSR